MVGAKEQIGLAEVNFASAALPLMRRLCFIALLALLLCGCANVEYTAYSGAQQNWPVASGSFVQRKFDLPVYFGPPDRPYRVLGDMEVESAPLAVWESGKNESIKPAVKEAAKHGGDAVILLTSGANVVSSSTFNSANWGSNTTVSGSVYGNNFRGNSNTSGAPGEPLRRCRCAEATQRQLPLSFCKREQKRAGAILVTKWGDATRPLQTSYRQHNVNTSM